MNMNGKILHIFSAIVLFGAIMCWADSDISTEKQYLQTGGNQRDILSNVPPESLCHMNEWIVFSCPVKKNKIISVCASNDLTPKSGYMQYRFGTYNQQPDMIYPLRLVQPHDYFEYFTKSEGNDGIEALGFHVKAYKYSVYIHSSDSVHGYDGGGVIVRHYGKRISVMRCLNDRYYVSPASSVGPSKYISYFYLIQLQLPAPKKNNIDFIYE